MFTWEFVQCVFSVVSPLFTETVPNIRTNPALPYYQYSTISQSSNVTKPSSTKSGGPNMKIKQQLPSLIRSNSRQARVTKAEQEKPLTANHCIDRQASPTPPDQPTSPPFPLPSLPTDPHVYCGSSAFTLQHAHVHRHKARFDVSMRRDTFGGSHLICSVSTDSLIWIPRFCRKTR